jgi:hypothetical protein
MEEPESPEKLLKSIQKTDKYANKVIPKFLKYIGKINEIKDYDVWKKETIVSIVNFILDYLIILAFLFFLCLTAIDVFRMIPPTIFQNFFLAEGISIAWYLALNLKKDLWGKNG